MNNNIEIKARAQDFPFQFKIAEILSDTPIEVLYQKDTFFNVQRGRLKLRKFNENLGELIYYKRSDTKKAKRSQYKIYPTQKPDTLIQTLELALGIIGVVEKKRSLFKFGQTRIHLDEVKFLGKFIEFEYVLRDNEPPENGRKIISDLMRKMQIREKDLIGEAYIELLLSDK